MTQRCKSLSGEEPRSSSLKGEWWVIGQRDYSLYTHVIAPNQPSCFNTPGSKAPVEATTATSLHPGGVNSLFADGHAQFVRDSVSDAVWRAIGTRDGSEAVSSESY
ncbi:MAG: H-X9-DG-CTERM domain-containing protein [Isosphaeraceae bacterium]